MSTIANAKVEHNYNCYNGYFFGCLRLSVSIRYNAQRNSSVTNKDIKKERLFEAALFIS